jgi:PAS domain S-box-containing protein
MPSRADRTLDAITMAAGLLCTAGGLTVMAAWFARATSVLRVAGQNPMTFNSASGVALTGVAMIALVMGRPRAALTAGAFGAVLGTMTLAEWALGRGLGIDQLVVRAYIRGPGSPPGRPSVDSAVCLTLAGLALLVWGPWRSRTRPAVMAAAGSLIGAIAFTVITGYATGTPPAHVWALVTAMPLLTAVAMLTIAVGLLCAAWRDTLARHAGLPGWLAMVAGAAAFGVADVVWLAIIGGNGGGARNAVGTSTDASAVLGLLMAGLVTLVAWLAQQADGQARVAVTKAARTAAAAREAENLLFRLLGAMPVAVFISTPAGVPYYANGEAERVLGRGVQPDIGVGELAEVYRAFVAGTDRIYPAERLPVVRASLGESSHVSDIEIRKPDSDAIPVEVWGRPVRGTRGEIEYCLAVFADMSERHAREKTAADQAALLDLAHDAILVRDRDSRITYWNAGAERTYGYTRAEALGRISHELLDTKFPAPVADIEADTARDGRWEGELTHRCADGRTIVVESRWVAQHGPDRSLLKFLEINRDVTARKTAERETLERAEEVRALNATLEQQVRQRTASLRRANRNLADFTYSIAHDLRTPLRAMSGYAEALAEEYGNLLGETGSGYTGRIQAAAGHMATLIDNLSQLSRVSQAEMNLQVVDLSAEVTAICDRLRARDPCRRVRVRVEDGVRVTADRGLILVVLENLLANAWKFTAPRDDAFIEFAGTTVGGAPCCYVRDNGVGFDPAYADKLFGSFQRLHAGEFPGTGIGLATVQRIVERHGGHTWAEGAVDRGATFYFTLAPDPSSGSYESRDGSGQWRE